MAAISPNPLRRVVDEPQEGYFRMKLVKRGPYVPARIQKDENGRWLATIDGKDQFPPHEDPILASGVLRIWHSATEIQFHEYDYLIQLGEYARAHAPDSPAANPNKPIDLLTLPLVY